MHWNIVYTGITLLSTDDKHIQKTKNSLRRPPAAAKVQHFPLHLIFRKLCSSLAHKRLVFIKNQTLTGCVINATVHLSGTNWASQSWSVIKD